MEPSETQILEWLADGQSPQEIAFTLGCSVKYVQRHCLARLRKRYNVQDTLLAVIKAVRAGDVKISDRLITKWREKEAEEAILR